MKPSLMDAFWCGLAGAIAGYLLCALLYERITMWWLARSARKDARRYEIGHGPRGRPRHG